MIEGTGISLATSTGTFSNSNLTINNEGDLLINNEGYIGVEAGSSTSAILRGHNSSGTTTGAGTTLNAGDGLGISETTSTNGGQITLANKDAFASMGNTSETFSLTATTPKKLDFDTDAVTAVTLTTSLANNWITLPTTGTYEVSVSGSFESDAGTSVYTVGIRKDNSGTDTQVGVGQHMKSPQGTVPFAFSWINSFNANDRVYVYIESTAGTTDDIMRYLRITIKRIY